MCELPRLLQNYRRLWLENRDLYPTHTVAEETTQHSELLKFYEPGPERFERAYAPGHFTGSALIVNLDCSRVLLTLHAKLERWLQLGGHADGDENLLRVAYREGLEESGLTQLKLYPLGLSESTNSVETSCEEIYPFDVDTHLIPTTSRDPSHYHYDMRFLFVADDSVPFNISDESHDLRWFTIDEAFAITHERSMHRQFHKLKYVHSANLTTHRL